VGRGVSPYEGGYHGVDGAKSRPMFNEALQVILAGLTGERLTHKGEYYRYEDVPMELRPVQQPYPPLWYATSNRDSVAWAAANGMHLMGLGPGEAFRPFVQIYREEAAQHRDDPRRLNPHVTEPRIGMNRLVVLADTDAEAEAIVRAAHPRYAASFVKLWEEHGDSSYAHRVALEPSLRHETILCGAPARVRAQVERLRELTGINYLTCCFAWGDLTLAQSLRSLRLFAEQVMPAFRA
jgi:alkanesulfonate monooxygenase SsuD/methylene tetrahydromethanopterin reductase-like flavin-dependent oxidoreductase (luciferase family)